jgi:hypothetical protein
LNFNRIAGLAGLATYAFLVIEMGRLWIAPDVSDVQRIQTLSVMMAFEFIMVHSGVFMAVFPKKMSLFLFVPFYAAFAFAMNAMTPGNTILYLYCAIVFFRMRFAFSDPNSEDKNRAMGMSLAAVMTYFFLVLGFAIGSEAVPELGLTQQFLIESGYIETVKGGGIFVDKPNVPMALGVVYFSLIALWEIKIYHLFEHPTKTAD